MGKQKKIGAMGNMWRRENVKNDSEKFWIWKKR